MSKNTDLISNFEFDLIGGDKQPFVGYISSTDRTIVSPNALVKGSKNMFLKLSGNWANREGLKLRGEADDELAPIVADFVWNTSLGKTIPLRVVDFGSGQGELEFETDVGTPGSLLWRPLIQGLDLTRFVFDSWWDDTLKKDELLCVKGDPVIHKWSGGMGVVASTTMDTITLTEDAVSLGFESSGGSLTVDTALGAFTYSGISGNTLTGVVGDPTSIPAGFFINQDVDDTDTTSSIGFDNDFLKVINNQVYVGSYTSRLTAISSQSDYTDYTVPAVRAPGNPELLTLDAPGRGIGLRAGAAHIFAGTSYLHIVNFQQITVGAVLTEQTTAPRQDLANLQAALAHEFIDTVGDSLIYLSQENQVVAYGSYRNINTPKYPSLSLAVRTELQAEDFTGGCLRCSDEFIFVTAPLSGITYIHQTREKVDPQGNITAQRFWHTPHVWNVSRICVIDGVLFGHSNANPTIFQLFDTDQWHDDSSNLSLDNVTYENIPYYCVARHAYRNHGRRQGRINFDKIYFEGYMTQGTQLDAFVLAEYQGAKSIQNPNINSIEKPAYFFIGANSPSLGDSPLGDNPLGDGIIDDPNDQEFLPKFRAICNVNIKNCFEYQIIEYSNTLDARWEILCMGTNAQFAPNQQATFLNK